MFCGICVRVFVKSGRIYGNVTCCFLSHINASSHTALVLCEFFAEKSTTTLFTWSGYMRLMAIHPFGETTLSRLRIFEGIRDRWIQTDGCRKCLEIVKKVSTHTYMPGIGGESELLCRQWNRFREIKEHFDSFCKSHRCQVLHW